MSKGMTIVFSAICLLILVTSSEAGFRCFFGDWACSGGCKVLGQKSGLCDDDGKCWCSEEKISLDNFRSLLPSRCDLGTSFCQGTCHAIGRRDGSCTSTGCTCSNERLSPTEFALCAAASTCRMHCQAGGYASGVCQGWSCDCQSNEAFGGDQRGRASGTCEGWSCRCQSNEGGELNEF